MSTVLIRLSAPLQAWGTASNFSVRDTGREPSKSGVIGLMCAALGRPRTADVADLAGLRMGVRADREGRLAWDYQIAQDLLQSGGGTKNSEPSTRYYLAGAVFLVGLSGSPELLETLHAALQDPVWSLYLGRKAFVPAEPLWLPDGLRLNEALETALQNYGCLAAHPAGAAPERLRLVLDDPHGSETRLDVPLSFAERRFAQRRVSTTFIPCPLPTKEVEACISQD